MVVKQAEFDGYNDWMAPRFPKFSWGAADCTSYYRNASGHAPFLFPGNFKEYSQQHAEISLQDYELS
jgi:cyclohexanone monooxygenase